MRYRNIQGTDLNVSCLCLGTADMGSNLKEEESFRLLDAFVDRGGNFIDTAHVYGDWVPGTKSLSEKLIGKWLKQGGKAKDVIVATKGAHPELGKREPRLSREDIVKDLDESLEFLGLERIDLYYLHRDDPSRPVSEILETLNEQVKKGKIRYFACSNWRVNRLDEAVKYAEEHGLQSFKANQILWNYAVSNHSPRSDSTIVAMDSESREYYKKTGIAVVAFTSQARGFFAKLEKEGPDGLKSWVRNTYYNEENLKRFERAKELAGELSTSISAIVLAYLTSQPFTTIPIVGCQNLNQLDDSMRASDLELTPEMLQFLENG